jgi:hypothetical protein
MTIGIQICSGAEWRATKALQQIVLPAIVQGVRAWPGALSDGGANRAPPRRPRRT